MVKRGQEIRVRRIAQAQGYVWAGYWEEHPNGEVAVPVGRIRKIRRYVHMAEAIWLDIGGYLIL